MGTRDYQAVAMKVRLMPPALCEALRQAWEADAGDAEAICEAVRRPTMRAISRSNRPISEAGAGVAPCARDLFVKRRTQLVNMIRSLPAGFGIEIRRGIEQALMAGQAHRRRSEVPGIPPLAAKVIAGSGWAGPGILQAGWVRSNANCWSVHRSK